MSCASLRAGSSSVPMHLDARDPEAGHAGLAGAEHVAFAAQAQILLGDAEAVLGLAHDLDARLGGLAERRAVEQQAGRALAPAPDAAAQLVDLREAEALGVLDHHHGRLRHVDADLDHRGGDQEPRFAGGEARHRGVLVGALHAAVDEIGDIAEMLLQRGEALLGGGEIDHFGFRDQRTDPVDPLAALERAPDRRDHIVDAPERHRARVDRLAAGRLLAQLRDIHVAEIGEHQRARDRRRGHHQHVDRLALAREREALVHAEAVLLVDDREREIAELDLVLEQRMRADEKIELAGGEALAEYRRAPCRARGRSGSRRAGRRPRRAARSSCGAGARGFRSAPSGRPAARPRSRWRRRAAPRPSCPSRHRPAAGAACARAWRGRRRSPSTRARLRRRQRIGQRAGDLRRDPPVAGARPPGEALLVRAHQRERELAGEQFVIGEPRPGGRFGRDRLPDRPDDAARCSASPNAGHSCCRSHAASCHSGSSGTRPSAASAALRTTLTLKPSVSG